MTWRPWAAGIMVLLSPLRVWALEQDSEPDITRVGILVYDGVFNTEFVAPMDVFDHADRPEHPVEVFLVAPSPGPVRSVEGLVLEPHFTFADHPPIHILVIPSFQDYDRDLEEREDVIGWIRQQAEEARYVLSNCWGAFYLARAGLLEGRAATTYPPDTGTLARRFPGVRVLEGFRFVRHGKFVTGEGGVSSYLNALYVVQELWGEELARRIASGLLLAWDLREVPHHVEEP